MAKRQRFTKEFKIDAIRLWKSSGRPAAAVGVAGESDAGAVSKNQCYPSLRLQLIDASYSPFTALLYPSLS